MQERRRRTRTSLMAYSQVFDLYGGMLLGYLADLTESGAMVIGEKPIETGREMTLNLEVPELPDSELKRLTLEARVVWCQPDISPEFQNIGFEFKEVKPDQMHVLRGIIEVYEFNRNIPRYPVRPPLRR
ncbi:MAG TPA: PilZ domain-containing protein [Anaerolineales bacterium]